MHYTDPHQPYIPLLPYCLPYFESGIEALSFDTTEKRDEMIATIHLKGLTSRPQTLNEWNKGYKKVLKTFEEITGVGVLLNTSFNLHGYPIVGTPEQAIWVFENSKLDALALGNYLVTR